MISKQQDEYVAEAMGLHAAKLWTNIKPYHILALCSTLAFEKARADTAEARADSLKSEFEMAQRVIGYKEENAKRAVRIGCENITLRETAEERARIAQERFDTLVAKGTNGWYDDMERLLSERGKQHEATVASMTEKLKATQEEVSRLFGQVTDLGGNPFKITGDDIKKLRADPVQLVMYCPAGHPHVDEGEWATKPHKTHRCQHNYNYDGSADGVCGLEWRPAAFPTVGVAALSE